MRIVFRSLVTVAALALSAAAPAGAQPFTFEDRPVAQPVTPLTPAGAPTTYGGLEFTNFFVGGDAGPGTGAGAVSGTQFAYVGHNTLGYGEIFSPTGTFTYFEGFLGYRSAQPFGGTPTVTLRGFDVSGVEVFTQALTLTTTSTYYAFSFTAIDALEFDVSALDADVTAGAALVLDDISTTVPEPGTVVLLATGLVGLAGVVRLRRRGADRTA